MKQQVNPQINCFVSKLLNVYFVYAPVRHGDKVFAREVKTPKEVDWSGQLTENPWKEFFLPHRERLFNISGGKLAPIKNQEPLVACLGMNILDLKALMLFDLVYANDISYQDRRKNIVFIGFSPDWPNDYKRLKVFSHNFEEDILEHINFDIFIAKIAGAKGKKETIKFYSGSSRGREILECCGISDFANIQFAGPISETGPDKRMLELSDKVGRSARHGLWNTLDEICLACGKCTIACPTCFCFDFQDKINPENSRRDRLQGNCFYNDFGKVAGGHRELDTVKKKIFFWYTHKFVRVPRDYEVPGCVGCGRCIRTCPVGIDIAKNTRILSKIKPVK